MYNKEKFDAHVEVTRKMRETTLHQLINKNEDTKMISPEDLTSTAEEET